MDEEIRLSAEMADGEVMAEVVPEMPPSQAPPPMHSQRDTLDREVSEIKDEVLRMGSLVAAQIGAATRRLLARRRQLYRGRGLEHLQSVRRR